MIPLLLSPDLPHAISIREAISSQDAIGGEVEAPAVVAAVMACVQPMPARAASAQQRMDGRVITHRVFLDPASLPAGLRITRSHQVAFGSRTFSVVDAIDHQERGQLITLFCEESGP